jgi:Arc/MetJ family transcription regulator
MKTTIDLDESKLLRLMDLTGIKTRKEAINYALTEAERMARYHQLMARDWTEEEIKDALDPSYDLAALSEKEKPLP